jgi:hypothetical protein
VHVTVQRPPARPRDLSPEALGFHRQPAVRWFSPAVLAVTGLRVVLSSVFGSFLDKRELQARLECDVDRQHAGEPEIWLDYVADTGDGFDATYSVASLLARRRLHVEGGDDLPRSQVLVLGGDQTYPVATPEECTNRFEGPFRTALPWTVDDHPALYALPGNHDWYDGLTSFLRQFAQQRWIGGWKTHQTRSYFALQLPSRWWFWGMDIQADHYIDQPQLDFFDDVLGHVRRGDRLVLATASPTWIDTHDRPQMYRNLAYVQRHLLEPAGVELKLALAGNLHHYNRYRPAATPTDNGRDPAPDGPQLVTSGGGGAFLYATHHLPPRLQLPLEPGVEPGPEPEPEPQPGPDGVAALETRRYDLATCYPSRTRSRVLSFTALLMPLRNPGIAAVVGLTHVTLLWTNQFGIRSLDPTPSANRTFASSAQASGWQDLTLGLVRNSLSAMMLLAVAVGLIVLADPPAWARRPWQAWLARGMLGLLHTAVQVVAVVGASLLAIRVASPLEATGFVVATSVLDAVLGGIAGSIVLGAYFALGSALPGLHVHGNEAFAAARLTCFKNFVRLHVDHQGRLTVYAIGLDRVTRHWHLDGTDETDPERSWLLPDQPLTARLVDRFTVD